MIGSGTLADLYTRLQRALDGLDWYLFGARAAIVYGSARATVDVDIGVRWGDDGLDPLIERLAATGIVVRVAEWRALAQRARVLLLRDEASGTEVDLVLTGPGLEQEFHARARSLAVAGIEIPVISPEDLVLAKLLAGRPQDLQDIEAVLHAQPQLDLARIRTLAAQVESALARGDLLPSFERMVAQLPPRED